MRSAPDLESLLTLLSEAATTPGGDAGVLRLGTTPQWLVDALASKGVPIRSIDGPNWPAVQLAQRFGVVLAHPSGDQAAAMMHCAVQHVAPGGIVVICGSESSSSELADRFALALLTDPIIEGVALHVHRRTERFTIHDLVFEARSTIRRVDAGDLVVALASPSPPLVVDTRTHTDRQRFGVIAGSIHAPRTVVEWHLDPANGYQHPAIRSVDQPIVIVCNGGYSSSLAAANLARLGFNDVADLIGGMQAWIADGHPTSTPDHSHLDR